MKRITISVLLLLCFIFPVLLGGCSYDHKWKNTTLGYERSDPDRRTVRFKVIARIDGVQQYGETIDTEFDTDGNDDDVRIDNELSIANWKLSGNKIRSGQTYTITANVPCDVEIRFYWRGNTDRLIATFN